MNRTAITDLFTSLSRTFQLLAQSDYADAVQQATEVIATAFEAGNKLLVFGNGGSASDAQHICGELVGRFRMERRGLPAISLNDNPAVVTAWSNDYEFRTVFARQIEALGAPGDVAWGISTSGNSANVEAALLAARALDLRTIGMTGSSGGRIAASCDVLLKAPGAETARIQEVHLVTYHAICAAVEQRLATHARHAVAAV